VGLAEVLDRGLGLLPGVVFLPHLHQRLDCDNVENIAIFARRFAPRMVVGLENGATLEGPALANTGARNAAVRLLPDGAIVPFSEEAHALAP
jgi:hypothetical protein